MTAMDSCHVVVTGASGGVGLAVCQWLSDAGAEVYALDRQPGDAKGTFVSVDVTDAQSLREAADEVLRVGGRVDGLVAAAGVAEESTAFEDLTAEQWNRTIGVNLFGMFLTCQTFGRIMLGQGDGRIVTIASMSGNHIVNRPQKQAAYNASKAAVTALSKSLAVEWAPRGIRVNALSPGYIATPMVQSKKDLFDTWVEQIPVGRMATPQETAAAVGFLLSDDAAYFVGSELLMDGGYSLW